MKVDEINIHGVEWYHWDFQRIGMKGVGKNQAPIINMDKYIDHSMDEELHNECCVGITLCEDIKMGQFVGSIPPFELKKYGIDNWTHVIKYLDKYETEFDDIFKVDTFIIPVNCGFVWFTVQVLTKDCANIFPVPVDVTSPFFLCNHINKL